MIRIETAVGRLNELVDFGLLVLVSDPSKRFGAGESRSLYVRTVDSVLDAELTSVVTEESKNLGTTPWPTDGGELGRPKLILVNGEIGSRMHIQVVRANARTNAKANANSTANLQDVDQRPDDLDHAS